MKRISVVLPLFLCLGAGLARWLDLVNYTDLSTGFAIAGPYWLRYGALAAVVAGIALLSLMTARCPASLYQGSRLCGVLCMASGAAFAVLGGYTLAMKPSAGYLAQTINGGLMDTILGVLYLLSAFWLLLAGVSRMGREAKEPSGHILLGILGTVAFLLLTFREGLSEAANIQRITVVWNALGGLFALWFGVRMVRACYLPDTPVGRGLYLSGWGVFLMNTCLLLPQAVCLWMAGYGSTVSLMKAAALGLFGLVGMAFAVTGALGEETDE